MAGWVWKVLDDVLEVESRGCLVARWGWRVESRGGECWVLVGWSVDDVE